MSSPHERPKPVTTPEEFEAALGPALESVRASYDDTPEAANERDGRDLDEERYWTDWHALHVLQSGDVALVEPRIVALASDRRWEARALVAEVLRHLTGPYDALETRGKRKLGEPAVARAWLLCAMASVERDDRVLNAIVCAFVDLEHEVGDEAAAAFACRFVDHPSADVRRSAVAVLCGNETPAAIAALVSRVHDSDAEVRYWACCGLGRQLWSPEPGETCDTPELRNALAACLADPLVDAREEAATGLARRGDERGLAAVGDALSRFETEGVSNCVLWALAEAPRARFAPLLDPIVEAMPDCAEAREALDVCRAAAVW